MAAIYVDKGRLVRRFKDYYIEARP